MTPGGSPAVGGPVIVLALLVFSVWFGNNIFRGIDRFYRPSVQKWMTRRPKLDPKIHDFDVFNQKQCLVKDPDPGCFKAGPSLAKTVDDDYLDQLEQELKVLRELRGLTGPDPRGKFKVKAATTPPIVNQNKAKCCLRFDVTTCKNDVMSNLNLNNLSQCEIT